jgi:hypothetical protein
MLLESRRATMAESNPRRISVNHTHEKSREEALAAGVLELVDRFHEPASPGHRRLAESRRIASVVVPAAVETLALLSLARRLRGRHRGSDRCRGSREHVRRGMLRAFAVRHP